MLKFRIPCPDKISGKKGDTVTLYRNTKGLYVAILNGVEVGLANELEADNEEDELPSCIDCEVYNSFKERYRFTVLKKEEDA